MSEEIMKILKMVKKNKITPEEGERLIAAISEQDSAQDTASKHKGTMLRIKIDSNEGSYQLSFVQLDDPLLEKIKEDILKTDINTLTPVEALMKLNDIKRLLSKKKK